jgi:hypothetical protein
MLGWRTSAVGVTAVWHSTTLESNTTLESTLLRGVKVKVRDSLCSEPSRLSISDPRKLTSLSQATSYMDRKMLGLVRG